MYTLLQCFWTSSFHFFKDSFYTTKKGSRKTWCTFSVIILSSSLLFHFLIMQSSSYCTEGPYGTFPNDIKHCFALPSPSSKIHAELQRTLTLSLSGSDKVVAAISTWGHIFCFIPHYHSSKNWKTRRKETGSVQHWYDRKLLQAFKTQENSNNILFYSNSYRHLSDYSTGVVRSPHQT